MAQVTPTSLINACPAPVSTAEGVTQGIYWFELTSAFCIVSSDSDVPNRLPMRNKCDAFSADTKVKTTDYDSLNNNLMHIKGMLQAVVELQST